MVEKITKNPSRRRARHRQNQPAGEAKAAPAKAKAGATANPSTKSQPVVDVPAGAEEIDTIVSFKNENRKWFTKFLQNEFGDEADSEIINAVIDEVAECKILSRTAKPSDYWDGDTIEYILDEFDKAHPKAAEAPQPKKKLTKKVKAASEVSTKETAKKVAKPPKEAATKPKRAKKAAKKAKTSQEAEEVRPVGRPGAVPSDLTASDIRAATGNEQWELAIGYLRRERKFWCQAQDIPALAKLLRSVNEGIKEIPDKFAGDGSRSYGRDKLARCLQLIRDVLGGHVD